ncbi:pentraxin-related protein PTX3-like [Scyliorhinus torazame]|uniref:pentraxin-related protein PTX3-like n=1 Tax=Scyliorhinus torazame TaxID=75743 RepID=UPI003B593E5B
MLVSNFSVFTGCWRILTFPALLKGQHAIILPVDNHNLLAFTACIWAKPSIGTNGTALFSYSTEGNHTQFQLYLGRGWVQLSVGTAEVRVRARPAQRWTHYCGIWDGDSGDTTLVVDGQAVATRSTRAGPRTIPGRGAVRLGHRGAESHEGGEKALTTFAGKLTGFNLWDSALTEVEIGHLLRSKGCDVKGNMVGWDDSPVTEGAGVLFH